MNKMQSTLLVAHLSLKETCNIIDNDVWERSGFGRLITFYFVLNDVGRSVFSLFCRLLLNTWSVLIPIETNDKLSFSNKWFDKYTSSINILPRCVVHDSSYINYCPLITSSLGNR